MEIRNESKRDSNPQLDIDVQRHKAKIREELKKRISALISDQSLIPIDNSKMVTVRIRSLKEFRFAFQSDEEKKGGRLVPGESGDKKKRASAAGGTVGRLGPGSKEYDANFRLDELIEIMLDDLDVLELMKNLEGTRYFKNKIELMGIRKSGSFSRLNKKATVKRKIARERATKQLSKKFIPADYRYRHSREMPDADERAVIFLVKDKSGSMDKNKHYLAKALCYCFVLYLQKTGYEHVDICFINHDESATECSEEDFFAMKSDGGTKLSSGTNKVLEIINEKYSPKEWDIYVWHASDGENTAQDNGDFVDAMENLCKLAHMINYCEINATTGSVLGSIGNMRDLARRFSNLLLSKLDDKNDVKEILREFIAKSNERRRG
ncbi:MAG: DUF444 family protein [Patescibacteria group bacterium]